MVRDGSNGSTQKVFRGKIEVESLLRDVYDMQANYEKCHAYAMDDPICNKVAGALRLIELGKARHPRVLHADLNNQVGSVPDYVLLYPAHSTCIIWIICSTFIEIVPRTTQSTGINLKSTRFVLTQSTMTPAALHSVIGPAFP